jgi:hypothetical protein
MTTYTRNHPDIREILSRGIRIKRLQHSRKVSPYDPNIMEDIDEIDVAEVIRQLLIEIDRLKADNAACEKKYKTAMARHMQKMLDEDAGVLAEPSEAEAALNPRLWTEEMANAWHRNIPDVYAAFKALREAAKVRRGSAT